MYRLFAVLLFVWAFFAEASGPVVRFDRLSLEQGLSQSAVAAITQDRRGFVWIGTEDGLNRYDGYEFKIFRHRPGDPGSLSGNHIKSLLEDKYGQLWIGTLGTGLNRFDARTGRFVHFTHVADDPDSISNDSVWALYQDGEGRLWIGTEGGINLYDGKKFVAYRHKAGDDNSLSSNNVRAFMQDSHGYLWVGTYGGGLNRFDIASGRFEHFRFDRDDPNSLSNDKVLSIYQDGEGMIWVGTEGGGLNRLDPATGRFTRYRHDPSDSYSLSNDEVWDMHEDERGNFWLATQGGGLNRFDRKSGRFYRYLYHPAEPTSISNNNLWTLYCGPNGIVWIGTNGGGISKFDLKRSRFGHYKREADDPYSLSHDSVFAFLTDSRGTLWVGTDSGLNRLDANSDRFVHYKHDENNPNSISQDWVMALKQDSKGRLWVGTLGGGLNLLDRDKGHFSHFRHDVADSDSLSDDRVSVIFEDSKQRLWVGTWSGGVNRYDERQRKFIHYRTDDKNSNSLSHDSVMAINEDKDGNLWFGTFNGLNRLDVDSGRFTRYFHRPGDTNSLSHSFVTSILPDDDGGLWLGTFGGGLNHLDRKSQRFSHFRQSDGLANDSIYGLLKDSEGHLWLSSNQGLSHFDPGSGKFENYDVVDGLQSNEFNGVSYYRSPAGELFFGGINGFNRFYPHRNHWPVVEPNVVFTDFLLFNQSVPVGKDKPVGSEPFRLPGAIDGLSALTLSHRESLFSFEFAALEYTNPDKIRYAYRLKGFNDEWIETSAKNRRATFSSLPPGSYRLEVRADSPNGAWHGKQATIALTILPPPWQSWWAYTLYVAILIALLLLVYWMRQYYSRTRLQLLANSQLKQIMQAQLVAGELREDLGELGDFQLLVVDDEVENLQVLETLLIGRHYRITCADSGEKALQKLWEEGPFDLVLLDVAMPKLSGYQVCRKIREVYSATELPVIFMTDRDQWNEMMESFAVGANDYLEKPVVGPDLLNRIDTQLKLLVINRNLAQSNQSIKALSVICTEISTILDLDKLMDTVYTHIKELMDVDAFALGLYDEKSASVSFRLTIEQGRYLPDYTVSTAEKNRPAIWCIENKKPLIINDLEKEYADYFGDQPLPPPKAGEVTRSFVYWPLLVAGRIVGVLSIQSYRRHAYDSYQVKTIKTLASTAAIALDNAKAYRAMEKQKQAIEDKVTERTAELEQSNKNITTLSEICTEISTTLDYNKILETVFRRIKELMDADVFMIGLLDTVRQHIEFKLAIKWGRVVPPFILELDDVHRAAIWCYRKQTPLVVNDIETDLPEPLVKLPFHDDEDGRKIESFMYFPLIVHGQIIGVLTVQSYRPNAYSEHQQDMIGTIASTTAIALDNANAYRELEQKNNQILATQKKLIQSENLASLGTLTAGIAHEINNPTNFVHVSSQNLEVDLAGFHDFLMALAAEDADQEILESFEMQFKPLFEHIATIKEGTGRIKSIVKDLRGFTYLDTDEKNRVDLEEMLISTINLAKTKYAQLADFETDFNCPVRLNCYPAQLNQVFMNLIVNACDAIRDKQRTQAVVQKGHILVGCYCRGDRIDITFKDDGCGMDESIMEKLFVPFYTTKQVGEGTGLGLSISYKIVQKHDGELTVKSEPGVGTEFRVRLPVEPGNN